MTLAHFRRKIDQLDRRLVALLNRRARAAERIGHLKRKARMAIYEPRRESMILD
ncbi:MAG: chorismate mutase, partial [Burkholderiales bacterium]